MCVGGEAAALSPHCSSEEPGNTLTLALKQACIFQNEDTDPEHERHKKARRSTARPAAATRSAGASHLKNVLERNGLMMLRVSASQHYHDKNYVLETVILTIGAYKEVFSSLGEKELPVKK